MTEILGTTGGLPGFLLLIAVTFAASLARGFSGFGAALIFVPLGSAILGPKVAVPLLLVADGIMTVGMIPAAAKVADWRAALTMALGAFVGVPTGIWVLKSLDPLILRWAIFALAALMLVLLLSGWRYRGHPKAPLTALVGLLSGFCSGVAQIGGPPVVAYWLGGTVPATLVRANIILFFAMTSLFSATGYLWSGLFTVPILTLAAAIAPVYGSGAWLGSRMFGLASEKTFRRICLVMIAGAMVVSMPAMDHWLRGA